MKTDKPISRQEAAQKAANYLGCKINVKYTLFLHPVEKVIDGDVIHTMLHGFVESFHFTGLRTIPEMTEEEKDVLNSLGQYDVLTSELAYKAMGEKLDYLRSIGIATGNENMYNYIIKD